MNLDKNFQIEPTQLPLACFITDGREVADKLTVGVSAELGAVEHSDTGLHEDRRIVVVTIAHAPVALVSPRTQACRPVDVGYISVWPILEFRKLSRLQIQSIPFICVHLHKSKEICFKTTSAL